MHFCTYSYPHTHRHRVLFANNILSIAFFENKESLWVVNLLSFHPVSEFIPLSSKWRMMAYASDEDIEIGIASWKQTFTFSGRVEMFIPQLKFNFFK